MTDARSAWNTTGEQLTQLGQKLGAHYESQRDPEGQQARAQTEEAIKRLGGAIQDAFEAVGAAAKDDAVRQDVKQVGRSLVGALDVTFREVSEEVRKAFDKTRQDAPPTKDAPTDEPEKGAPPA